MDKGSQVHAARTATRNLRRAGIRAAWFLQLGYPPEDWDDIVLTRDLVHQEMPDDVGVSVAYPLPGTPFHDRLAAELGPRRNWRDTAELAMLFHGTFDTAFYRLVRDALHADVAARRADGRALARPCPARPGASYRAAEAVGLRWPRPRSSRPVRRSTPSPTASTRCSTRGAALPPSAPAVREELLAAFPRAIGPARDRRRHGNRRRVDDRPRAQRAADRCLAGDGRRRGAQDRRGADGSDRGREPRHARRARRTVRWGLLELRRAQLRDRPPRRSARRSRQLVRPGGKVAARGVRTASARARWSPKPFAAAGAIACAGSARGDVAASLGGRPFTVRYHRRGDLERAMAPAFRLTCSEGDRPRSVPPSAGRNRWISRHPRLLAGARGDADRLAARRLAALGDHVLYAFERVEGVRMTSAVSEALDRFRLDYAQQRASEGPRASRRRAGELAVPVTRGPLARQWQVRARTFEAFLAHVVQPMARRRRRPLRILDLGAGNGWLCHRLALEGHRCAALDIRADDVDGLGAAAELSRIAPFERVVAPFERLPVPDRSADLAVFNASLHYATELAPVLRRARRGQLISGRMHRRSRLCRSTRDEADGEAMVREKHLGGRRRVRIARARTCCALPFVEFLTRARIERALGPSLAPAARELPAWYELRPLVARWKRRRAPSRVRPVGGRGSMTVLSARDAYRLWAPAYEAENAITHLEQAQVAALGPSPAGRRLLDARLRHWTAARAVRRVARDRAWISSPEMLAQGRRNPALDGADLVEGDLRALPLPDRAFDVVWCRLAIGHLAELDAAYAELTRVAAPGATVIVTDFHTAAHAAGHRRTFRCGGEVMEVAHYPHTADRQIEVARCAGLTPRARSQAVIGPRCAGTTKRQVALRCTVSIAVLPRCSRCPSPAMADTPRLLIEGAQSHGRRRGRSDRRAGRCLRRGPAVSP